MPRTTLHHASGLSVAQTKRPKHTTVRAGQPTTCFSCGSLLNPAHALTRGNGALAWCPACARNESAHNDPLHHWRAYVPPPPEPPCKPSPPPSPEGKGWLFDAAEMNRKADALIAQYEAAMPKPAVKPRLDASQPRARNTRGATLPAALNEISRAEQRRRGGLATRKKIRLEPLILTEPEPEPDDDPDADAPDHTAEPLASQ